MIGSVFGRFSLVIISPYFFGGLGGLGGDTLGIGGLSCVVGRTLPSLRIVLASSFFGILPVIGKSYQFVELIKLHGPNLRLHRQLLLPYSLNFQISRQLVILCPQEETCL